MFSVKLYQFAKRNDSTKQPLESAGVEYQCVLKDNTGVLAPVFRFKYSAIEQIYLNNYMFVPRFNRYYFLSDWEWNAGEWVSSWTVDPLATYRTEISNLRATIERTSNYLYYNQKIVDPYAIVSTGVEFETSKISTLIGDFAKNPTEDGMFIVGVNNGESITGAVAYYALTFKAFYSVINSLIKQNPFDWRTTINNKANPLQFINSIYWCPIISPQFSNYQPINSIILFSSSSTSDNSVSIQLDSTWGQCYALFDENDNDSKGLIRYLQYPITIPAISVPEWLATTSFRYTMTAPFLATIDLPSEMIGHNADTSKTYYLKYKINMQNGDAVINISETDGTSYSTFFDNVLCTFNAHVGVNVLYGERQSNVGDILFNSMSSLVGSFTSGSFIPMFKEKTVVSPTTEPFAEPKTKTETEFIGNRMGGFNSTGGAMGVLSAIGSFNSNTIVRGATPSFLDAIDYVHLSIYRKSQLNEYDIGDLGVPCEIVEQIGVVADLEIYETTFIKCRTAHVDFNCTATERSMIESYLLNGFHFE